MCGPAMPRLDSMESRNSTFGHAPRHPYNGELPELQQVPYQNSPTQAKGKAIEESRDSSDRQLFFMTW
jgi:hypothetical protein